MVIFHSYVSLPEGIFYLAKWFKCPPCIWSVGNNSVEKVMNPRWVLWFHKVWQNSSTYWPIGSWCGVYIIRKHWVCPEIVDPKNMFFEQTWGTWISEWRITPKLELDVDDGLFFFNHHFLHFLVLPVRILMRGPDQWCAESSGLSLSRGSPLLTLNQAT